MKLLKLSGTISLLISFVAVISTSVVFAATSPNLSTSATYAILSSSYINTAPGTVLNGDLGFTTGPAVAVTVNGATHTADGNYNQAGIDQNSTLIALNNQACSYTFPDGPIDLATDITHGAIGNYLPGVYCTGASSAASIGAGGITLTGSGTFIFRIDGALTTVPNSVVTLASGASACDLWWTPTAATTLGANSTFAGTNIDASGITIGSTITWLGRALAFGGTISTSVDTISVPANCLSSYPPNTGGSGADSTNSTPGLPNTGMSAKASNNSVLTIISVLLAVVVATITLRIRKQSHSANS